LEAPVPFNPSLPESPSLPEVRSTLQEAGDYLNGLRQVDADKRDDGWRADVRSAVDTIHLLDGMESAMSAGQAGPRAALEGTPEARSTGTVGQQLVGADDYSELARTGRSSATFAEVEVRGSLGAQPEVRNLIDTDAGAPFMPQAQAAIPPVMRQRAFRLRDVMNVQTTGLANVPYIREDYDDSTDAGFTSEGAAKNEVSLGWSPDDAPARKVTAWIPVTTEIIEDAATLRGYIDSRLVDKIARAEEEAILAGNGSAPNLKGILNFTGIQQASYNPDTMVAFGLAIGAIEDHDADADGIVMRPTDYWAMVTSRQANSFDGGQGSAPSGTLPFAAGAANLPVWGLNVVRTRSCPAGVAIVGAFRQAATLFDRQRTTIRVGNQHADFFTTNKVAIVAEERLALAVHRPDLFVEVPLTD
jgi:HK97 family phage major capsid protein